MNLEEDLNMLEMESATERALSEQLKLKQEEVEFLRNELKKSKEDYENLKFHQEQLKEALLKALR